jgi:GNAT superfamily N-acetyltransferase
MADMLVRLYALPDIAPHVAALRQAGIHIRAARSTEQQALAAWVRQHFDASWAPAAAVAAARQPSSCYLAVEVDPRHAPQHPYDLAPQRLLGFACYDSDVRGMFGPTGVREDRRGHGIGTALLLTTLHAMRAETYAYAVIGWAGPVDWYARTVGATVIPDSEPGPFQGGLEA